MADDAVVADAPALAEKSWMPTRKWIAAEIAAVGTFLVALIQNEWQLSSELQVVLVGLVVQAVTTYLLKNADTPGGVPVK